jgi:hypothetical protein
VFDVRLKGIGGAGRILLDDALEDIAMLFNDLHERAGSTSCRRAPHQDHVSERIDVIGKPTISRECQQGVVKAAITPPHSLLIACRRSSLHRIKCRSQQTDTVFIKPFYRAPAGGDLEKQPNLKDFVEIMERGLQDADSMVALKPNHAARAQIDQRFTNRGPRHSKAGGKLPYRVEASWQKIARRDRIAKDFGDLLLEAHLLSDGAESIQAGFRSVRPSPGDFFQGALIVAHELFLDHPQVFRISPQRAGRQQRTRTLGRP